MDDTAFHYSRALRLIMILAIVIPITGIGLILWYFNSVDVPPIPDEETAAIATSPVATSTDHGFSLDGDSSDEGDET